MAYTFNDMGFLTNPQKTAAQALATLGAQISGPGGGAPQPGLTPPLTLSQTKRAKEMLDDLEALWRDVRKGINYSVAYYRAQAIQNLDNANP